MRAHFLEGRKREKKGVCELKNVACHRGLINWRGEGRRSGFMSLETWYITNKDSLTGGKEEKGKLVSPET
jgi:hypothetical protein